MPATAPNPKKKAAAPKSSAAAKPAAKPAAKKPTKNSNFVPNFLRGKITISPDFFEPHERPENWPSGEGAALTHPKSIIQNLTAMPATAPSPDKKAAPVTPGTDKNAVKTTKKSSIIPNLWKGKVTITPDFFEPHERPANWPSGE